MERTAVILGGSGGIGAATARVLAASGWSLVLAARDETRLVAVAEETGALAVACDARRPGDVDAVFARATERFGKIAAAVNCVGSILIKPAHLTTDDEWGETVALNLTSAFHLLRAAARTMRSSGAGGSIVLLSSAAARTGLASHEAIAAAKAGVIGLAQSAAATYASAGIRVNVVAPGLVRTPLASRITSNEAALKVSTAMHALGRIGEPDDVAACVAFLADPANAWITGQVLGVDGGLSTVRSR